MPTLKALGKDFFIFFKKNLCRAPHGLALGKEIFKKKLKKSLPSACRVGTRQSDRQRDRRCDGRFSLPSVPGALDKAFAECLIKDTRQRRLCRSIFCRVFFAECRTRQRLCRVQFGLCRVPQALGKEPESSSDLLVSGSEDGSIKVWELITYVCFV